MTTTPEEVSGSHALTTAEQLFCTLTAWHERVSVYVKGGVANVIGAQWRVYAINGSQRTLLFQGSSKTLLNEVVVGGIPGQGDTIALYGLNPFGVTASVKAYMVGWDPTAAVTPVQASSVAGVTLTLAEQDLSDLPGGYVNLDVAFNANGDPLARQAQIRLYALLGGTDRFQLEKFQVPDLLPVPVGSVNLLQNYAAGAVEFITTVQGRLGNSAVTVTGTLEGETGSAGAGGGGGPPVGSYWPTQVQLGAGITAPELSQAPAASDVAPQNIVMRAQDAFAGATVHETGGNIIIESGQGGGGSPLSGSISLSVDGGFTAHLNVSGTGIVTAVEAMASPEFIVTSGARTPVILSTSGIPAPSTDGPGSLILSNTYNGLYVQAEDQSVWNPVPILNSVGSIVLDPASTAPGVSQGINASGAGTNLRIISQQAKVGSTTSGGDMSFILGADDPAGLYPTNPRLFWFGTQTATGGHEPATNYNNVAILKWLPGGVANLLLGGGTNDIGGGVAGCEISAFTELNIATENSAPINIQIAGTGTTTCAYSILNHDTTDEAAIALVCTANHPTSGDAAALQINYTKTAIGSGAERYIDIQNAGVRQLSIKPYVLGGATIQVEPASGAYLNINNNAAGLVMDSAGNLSFEWAGVFGLKIGASAAQLSLDTAGSNTSILNSVATIPITELTTSKFMMLAGRNRHRRTVAGDFNFAATDDIVAISATAHTGTLPGSPADGDMYTIYCSAVTTAVATLAGNGHNIVLAGVSAATQNTPNGVALTVIYDGTASLWYANAGY